MTNSDPPEMELQENCLVLPNADKFPVSEDEHKMVAMVEMEQLTKLYFDEK